MWGTITAGPYFQEHVQFVPSNMNSDSSEWEVAPFGVLAWSLGPTTPALTAGLCTQKEKEKVTIIKFIIWVYFIYSASHTFNTWNQNLKNVILQWMNCPQICRQNLVMTLVWKQHIKYHIIMIVFKYQKESAFFFSQNMEEV